MKIASWSVNPNSPLPYYYQVERFLEQEICRGDSKRGEELPSEGELAKHLGVSVSVVRQALKRLEEKHLIERKKGKKAVVKREQKERIEFLHHQLSHYAELKKKGVNFSTKVMENSVIQPSREIIEKLSLGEAEKVVKLSRLRIIDKTPTLFWTSYLPERLYPGLNKLNLENKSLYATILDKYGIKPYSAERSFEVLVGETDICNLLDIHVGDPVIYIEWLSYSKKGETLEFYKAWHVSYNWKFIFHSKNL